MQLKKNARSYPIWLITVLIWMILAPWAIAGQFTTLYQFTAGSNGSNPYAGVAVSGSMLYGTTQFGGSASHGTVFKLNTDGTAYQVLHNLSQSDGQGFNSSLVSSGSMLYGITHEGGSHVEGTIFQVGTNGSGFQVLHNFAGGVGEGGFSNAGLTLIGSTLYGISGASTTTGGTVFKMDLGGAFQALHSFSEISNADMTPRGFEHPLVSGSTVYGTSELGGSSGTGAVFSVNTDGTGFQLLHSFDNLTAIPTGSLALSGTTLYGTTQFGGTFGKGTIFELKTDGTGFLVLHNFAGTATDGSSPIGGLVLGGSILYGTTSVAFGSNGSLFQMNIDGTGFQLLRALRGTDGLNPSGDLTLIGSTLFGTTQGNTQRNVPGTVFSITVPEPSSVVLAGLGFLGLLAWRLHRAKRSFASL